MLLSRALVARTRVSSDPFIIDESNSMNTSTLGARKRAEGNTAWMPPSGKSHCGPDHAAVGTLCRRTSDRFHRRSFVAERQAERRAHRSALHRPIPTTFSADRMASSIRFSQRARSWRWCEIDPTLGPALLDSLQTARYVDAMETSDSAVVASVAAKVGREHGHSIDEAVFALTLINDEGLSRRTGERIRKTRARMIELSESGVPFLLTTFGKHREVLQNSDLYSGPDVALKALESVGAATSAN
jgi:hypothetical protein